MQEKFQDNNNIEQQPNAVTRSFKEVLSLRSHKKLCKRSDEMTTG